MPLFTNAPPPIPVNPAPTNVPPVIGTAISYGDNIFLNPNMTQIAGTNWVNTYYARYTGEDDPYLGSGDTIDPTLKQYLKIIDFVFRVTEPLSFTTDADGLAIVTGTATVFPVITPGIGDVFIAEIEPGSTGIFEVTNATRGSLYIPSVWEIEFILIEYSTPEAVALLQTFVVNMLIFSLENLENGGPPLITQEEACDDGMEEEMILSIMNEYYQKVYDRRTQTFLSIGNRDEDRFYDPYLVEFWNYLFRGRDLFLDDVVFYNPNLFRTLHPFVTIFDALIRRDVNMIDTSARFMEDAATISLIDKYLRVTLFSKRIKTIKLPVVDRGLIVLPDAGDDTSSFGDSYIVGAEFYASQTTATPFEVVLLKAIKKEEITGPEVVSLLMARDTMTDLEYFYQVPLLLGLIQLVGEV